MTTQDPKLIELPVRMSHSKLWTIQQNYFISKGISAWKDEVPYYISSNAFIGHRYALLVIHYIQDQLKLNPQSQFEPFTILEIGAGPGKFSYYFLKAFKQLLPQYGLLDQPFCYVISDVVEENIEFCMQNESFKPFKDKNEIDFTLFNVAQDKDFYLKYKNKRYSELNAKNPLIIIANYTFDCISQDAFIYKNNQLLEMQLAIKSRYANFNVEKSLHLSDLKLKYETKEISLENYYEKNSLNLLLNKYCNAFVDSPEEIRILIPIGGLAFMDHMHHLTQGNYFLISGDKGVTLLGQIPLVGLPNVVTYDGCFSFMVNFDAMAEYSSTQGGDALLTEHNNDFKLALFSSKAPFAQLENTTRYFKDTLEHFGPNEFCSIFTEFNASSYRFSVPSLLSFLRLSEWDPDVYSVIHDKIMELLPSTPLPLKKDIEQDLQKTKQNIYGLHFGDDFYNLLGIYYQTTDAAAHAIECYEKSIMLFKDKCASHNNLAILYEKQKNTEKAIYHYRQSYTIDKSNKNALKKAEQLEGKTSTVLFIPVVKSLLVLSLIILGIYFIQK